MTLAGGTKYPSFKELNSLPLVKHRVELGVKEVLEMPGIEPGASYMQSMRSTTELHPLICFAWQSPQNVEEADFFSFS